MALFRAENLTQAQSMIRHAWIGLVELPKEGFGVEIGTDIVIYGWWLTLPVWLLHLRTWLTEQTWLSAPTLAERSLYAGMMLAGLLMLYATGQQFIYFQF